MEDKEHKEPMSIFTISTQKYVIKHKISCLSQKKAVPLQRDFFIVLDLRLIEKDWVVERQPFFFY